MSGRDRDKNKTFLSGSEKKRKKSYKKNKLIVITQFFKKLFENRNI